MLGHDFQVVECRLLNQYLGMPQKDESALKLTCGIFHNEFFSMLLKLLICFALDEFGKTKDVALDLKELLNELFKRSTINVS